MLEIKKHESGFYVWKISLQGPLSKGDTLDDLLPVFEAHVKTVRAFMDNMPQGAIRDLKEATLQPGTLYRLFSEGGN